MWNWKLFLLIAAASLVHDRIHAIALLIMENRIHQVPSWRITNQGISLFFPVLGLTIDFFALIVLGAQFFLLPWQSALIMDLLAIALWFFIAPFVYIFFIQPIVRKLGITLELLANLLFFGVATAIFFWR